MLLRSKELLEGSKVMATLWREFHKSFMDWVINSEEMKLCIMASVARRWKL
jgi:hypothetical protein